MPVGRETAKGQIFEGGFARQWFIKKHLFKGSPIPVSDSQFDRATSVSPCLYKWMGRGAATRENRHARPTAIRPRVAVIEVIAILCPVNPPIPFVPPRRSSSPRRFPSPPRRPLRVCGRVVAFHPIFPFLEERTKLLKDASRMFRGSLDRLEIFFFISRRKRREERERERYIPPRR